MAATLSFRPPQFSEDAAWLPIWLQHCQGDPFNGLEKEPQTPSIQSVKELALQENVIERKDAILSTEEGRYNSFHLFLSGEDNSSVSFASPSEQAMEFHLHLSSADTMPTLPNLLVDTSQRERPQLYDVLSMQLVETSSEPGPKANHSEIDYNVSTVKLPHILSNADTPDLQNPLLVTPQAERTEQNDVLSIQQVESSAVLVEHADRFKMDHNNCAVNLFPLTSNPNELGNACPLFVSNRMESETQYELNCTASDRKDSAVDLAVELSIAASEALVIHELVKSGPPSETLSAAAVLEVSLRVKQARSEEVFLSLSEDNDEIDSLTDLDEITMADAFADVGLLITDPDDECVCDSLMYQVKETPIAGHLCEFDDRFRHMEHRAHNECFVNNSAKKQLEGDLVVDIRLENNLPSDILLCEMRKELCDVSTLGWKASSALDPTQHKSSQENLDCAISQKEVDNSTDVKLNNAKSIPKVFAGETSFLSESADVAPDQNSFVQKKESRSRIVSQSSIRFEGICDQAIVSQSSIPFEGICDQATEAILNSQDIVRSTSLSVVDPLCSVVPCSISSDTATSLQHQPFYKNATEFGIEKCFISTSDFEIQNSKWTSDVKPVNGKVEHLPVINRKKHVASVCRQSTSLKTCSMLSPNCDAFLGRGTVYSHGSCLIECNLRMHPSKKRMDGVRSSGERDETVVLPCRFTTKCASGRDNENYHKTSMSGDPITETANKKENCDETANGGAEFQVLLPEDRSSPLILNDRKCHRLQASTNFADNFTEKGNPKCSSALETLIELQHCNKRPMRHSRSEDPCNAHVPMSKRVRFSEAALELQQNKQLQKQHPAIKNRSSLRTSKRLKASNLRSDTRTQEVKRCLTNFLNKDNSNTLVFQGIEFLLTGFSSQKEKDIEGLVKKYGGTILSDIPSPPSSSRGKRSTKSNHRQIPVILCSKKLQTTKFLYGCAVNAYILKTHWLMDSIAAGSVLPPEKYMIQSNQTDGKYTRIQKPVRHTSHDDIFEGVGIMLHGKHSFCTKLAGIFKHGGGYVFKTLQWLVHSLDTDKISVGAIIAENKIRASRHLRHCALEQKIPMMSVSWIVNSLHLGRLLPFADNHYPTLSTVKAPEIRISMEFSEEI